MVFGFRRFTHDEYIQFKTTQNLSRDQIDENDRIYGQFETNFIFLGITAVEDQLQENVKEALVTLRQSNIKVWVLTGD